MIIPNIWENKKCSKPPTRFVLVMETKSPKGPTPDGSLHQLNFKDQIGVGWNGRRKRPAGHSPAWQAPAIFGAHHATCLSWGQWDTGKLQDRPPHQCVLKLVVPLDPSYIITMYENAGARLQVAWVRKRMMGNFSSSAGKQQRHGGI